MTPYGYKIRNGRAVVNSGERIRLITLFEEFIRGEKLIDAVRKAGIQMRPQTCKKMLANKAYLGTDLYPQIVPEDLFQAAQVELGRRTAKRKPMPKRQRFKPLPVYYQFEINDPGTNLTNMTPLEYALYQYERIQSIPNQA